MQVKVLGSAAGGGFPQWNCACPCCSGVRSGTLRGKPRTQTQVAIGMGGRFLLLDASPDLRMQMESAPALQPQNNGSIRNTPVAGVILTCAELDRTLGLLLLREFQPLAIYSTPSVRRILRETNSMFKMLERESRQARWQEIKGDKVALRKHDDTVRNLSISAVPLAGKYPMYVNGARPKLKKNEAVLALVIEDKASHKRLFYAPSLPETNAELKQIIRDCDVALLDGTFWRDDELTKLRGKGPRATAIGHVPILGATGTLEWLRDVTKPKKIYIHINNTNPVLDEESPEHAAVMRAGWQLAHDGMEFEL